MTSLIRRDRGFRLLWVGETTSTLGSNVAALAVPLLAIGPLHASAFAVSSLTAAAWLPWLVIGLPAGAWVDRLRRRRVMLVADVAAAIVFVSVPIAWWLGVLTITQLLLVAMAGGCATVFFETAYRALVPSIVAHDELTAANAALQGSESVTQFAGPSIAGALASTVGAAAGVLLDAISFVVSAICLSRLGDTEDSPVRAQRSLRREVREGWTFMIGDPYLRVLAVFGGVSNFVLTAFGGIQETFLIRTAGVTPAVVGVLLSAGALGGVAGAALTSRMTARFGTARTALATKVTMGGSALMLPLAGPPIGLALFTIGLFVLIGSCVMGNVIGRSFNQSYVPGHLLGRVSTAMQVLNFGLMPLGALTGGALAEVIGLRPAMWCLCGSLLPTAALLLIGPLKRSRELPTEPPAGGALETALTTPTLGIST